MPKFVVDSVENGVVTLRVPGNNYRNSFAVTAEGGLAAGSRVRGQVLAPAWKVDRVETGGNYVEPLYGRPRRMQGTILSIDTAANTLTVQVGYEATCVLPDRHRAADFAVGQRVGWDNIELPTFVPEVAAATPPPSAPAHA
jgi:hypothetical protein